MDELAVVKSCRPAARTMSRSREVSRTEIAVLIFLSMSGLGTRAQTEPPLASAIAAGAPPEIAERSTCARQAKPARNRHRYRRHRTTQSKPICSREPSQRGIVVLVVPVTREPAKPEASEPQTPPSFALDIATTPAQEVLRTVAAPTKLSFNIIRSGSTVPEGVAIDVGDFTNAEGVTVPVSISTGDAPDTARKHIEVGSFTQALLSANLHVKEFPAPGKYTGQLVVTTSSAGAKPTIWRFVLSSASEVRPATLVLDQNAVSLESARAFCHWFWCPAEDPLLVTVHVRDKTGNWPLVGVTARLEPGLKAPPEGFDTRSQIAINFNSHEIEDFFSTAASQSSSREERLIPAGQQATFVLAFTPRETGEYNIPLRFTAANSADDDLQKLGVTLRVRDNLILPVLVLFAAVLFSTLATRVISGLRQRAARADRLRTLRPAWLALEQPILPVIWLRAMLRQSEELSRQFWLFGSNEIDARLSKAAAMLAALDLMRQVRIRLNSIANSFVRDRAIWKFDKVVGKLGAASISDDDVLDFKKQLAQFDNWNLPADPWKTDVYWQDLQSSIEEVCTDVNIVETGRLKAKADSLADELAKFDKKVPTKKNPIRISTRNKAENLYQRLAILLELCRRGRSDVLESRPVETMKLDEVRSAIDNAWWATLKTADTGLIIEGPSATLDQPEAYETVTFRVRTPNMPFLVDTYLMKNKLTYDWTIEIHSKERSIRHWTKKAVVRELRVTSSQPQIVQYAPREGVMKPSLKLSYKGDFRTEMITGPDVSVGKSSDFSTFAKYKRADMIGFLLAALVSIVSGISLYALKPTFFGSLQDYLTLFTWGAGIDQTKNFLQALGTYGTTSSKPEAPAGGKAG